MNLDELINKDDHLELINQQSNNLVITGITDDTEYLWNHILFIKNKKFLNLVKEDLQEHTNIGIIIDKKIYEDDFPEELKGKLLFLYTSNNISVSICRLSKVFYQEKFGNNNEQVDGRQMGTADVHPTALISQGVFIGEYVKIGENVRIYSGAVIGSHTVIEKECEIFPNVTIYHNVKIGERCRIHAGSNIGTDGFGYNFDQGVHHKIYHAGGVIIENDVEVGSGCDIDCGTFSPTVIGEGCKLDNQVHVAHNVKLGKGVLLCAGVAIAGSSRIGDYSVFGGMSGMADNYVIGNECQIGGGAKVTGNWPDKSILSGHPARPLKEWLKGVAYLRKITEAKN